MKKLSLALLFVPMLVGAQPFGGGGPFPKPSASGNVIYTSMLNGIHTNANLVTGGGTDDHRVIQAALDKSTNGFPLTIIHDGCSMLTVGLIIHSNTTLYTLPNCGFWLSNFCDTAMLANDLNTNYTSRNITVIGGKWNQNGTNQHWMTGHTNSAIPDITTGLYTVGMWFSGCSNLVIKDVEVIQPTVYALLVGDSRDFRIDDFFANYAIAESYYGGDGIHLFADLRDGKINRYRGNAADDNITFDSNSNQDYWLTNVWSNPQKLCIQSNIWIDGVETFKGGPFWTRSQVINFQNDGSFIDFSTITDIHIKNVRCTDATVLLRGTLYGGRNFDFENFDVRLVQGSGSALDQTHFNQATNLIFRNWRFDCSAYTNGSITPNIVSVPGCSNVVVSDIQFIFGVCSNGTLGVLNGVAAMVVNDIVQSGGIGLNPSGTPGAMTVNNYVVTGGNPANGVNSINPFNLSTIAIGTFSYNGTTSFTPIVTNLIDGFRYTNNYGVPIQVSATPVLTTAAVNGDAAVHLEVVGSVTNRSATGTTVAVSLAQTYTNSPLSVVVPAGASYWFTNKSTGSGNSGTIIGGQLFVY